MTADTECWKARSDKQASGGILCCVLPAGHQPAIEHIDPVDGPWIESAESSSAEILTCYLCGYEWDEDSDGIRWDAPDEARCTDYDACTTRQIEQEQEDHR